MVPPSLSQRAQVRLDTEIDVPGYTIQGKLYHETLHPNGVINIATAENSLMSEELSEYMNTHCQITPSHLKYRTSITNGHVWSTVQAMPVYINDYTKPLSPVTPEHTVIGPGLGSIIAQFMWTVCDEGDGVLLTTPFYDDYRRDIVYPARAKVVLADVPPDVDALSLDCIPYLRSTILKSHQDGTRIRVLLLCNPHNPLARAYPAETITAYALLAEEFDLHLLVDEAFAHQVFASAHVPHPPPFVSVLRLPVCAPGNAAGVDAARIHVLGGPTKAFGASGLKLGALVPRRERAPDARGVGARCCVVCVPWPELCPGIRRRVLPGRPRHYHATHRSDGRAADDAGAARRGGGGDVARRSLHETGDVVRRPRRDAFPDDIHAAREADAARAGAHREGVRAARVAGRWHGVGRLPVCDVESPIPDISSPHTAWAIKGVLKGLHEDGDPPLGLCGLVMPRCMYDT